MDDIPFGARTVRRAPVSHYVLAFAFGAVLTIALALIVGAQNSDDFWVATMIGALCGAYPSLSLGTRIFVTNHTIARDSHGEESAEVQWMGRAAAGAFLDVTVTTIVISVVLLVSRAEVDALPALLALVGLSAVDAGLRYLVIRHRALR